MPIIKERIVYKGKKYNRYPESKRAQLRNYYWRHDKWKEPPFALHRQIWIDNFGDIPKGYIVHHKDGNTFNNNIENLQLLLNADHVKLLWTKEKRLWAKENIKVAQEAAKKWHGSKEGRKWHVKHYSESLGKKNGK
jgi:hypothetical protein